ncbi:MAG: type II CAAX endopeptidase family protein [Pseudomonadota bacterium]
MTNVILENFLQLIIISPILFFSLKKKNKETFGILLAFVFIYFLDSILLELPRHYPALRIFHWDTHWNWNGKFYATIGSILFLVFYRKFKLADYFLTFKQNKQFAKTGFLIVASILMIKSSVFYFYDTKMNWNLDTLLYQFSAPGINEEIIYRGIMLGLFTKVLKPKIMFLNPAIVITALLFGLTHGLSINDSFEINFALTSFLRTFGLGLVWAWLTLRSGSILLALVAHNLGNGLPNLIRMKFI